MNKRRPYIWIVEMWDWTQWVPTVGAGITRKDAERNIRQEWKPNNPDDRFRVRRYDRGRGRQG